MEVEAKGGFWKRKTMDRLVAVEVYIEDVRMNTITICGQVLEDAESVLVKKDGEEMPLIKFLVIDRGIPYTKAEPMTIEVNFVRETAMHIFPYIKRGKDVVVTGCLKKKKYTVKLGSEKVKFFISADYVILTGQSSKKNSEDKMQAKEEDDRRLSKWG